MGVVDMKRADELEKKGGWERTTITRPRKMM